MASKANLIFVQSLLLLLCTAGAGDVALGKKVAGKDEPKSERVSDQVTDVLISHAAS